MQKPTRWPSSGEPTSFGGLNRSELMSRIPSAGNKTTERRLAKLLRTHGLKGWRRNYPLRGKPDFVWRCERLAVFVDGCFWHSHACGRNLEPKRNKRLWLEKLLRTQGRDRRNNRYLRAVGWRVLRIWECNLARRSETCLQRIKAALTCQTDSSSHTPRRLP